jgi:hypothetical protein
MPSLLTEQPSPPPTLLAEYAIVAVGRLLPEVFTVTVSKIVATKSVLIMENVS